MSEAEFLYFCNINIKKICFCYYQLLWGKIWYLRLRNKIFSVMRFRYGGNILENLADKKEYNRIFWMLTIEIKLRLKEFC